MDCFTPPALRSLVIFAIPLLPLGPLPLVLLLPSCVGSPPSEGVLGRLCGGSGSLWELLGSFWESLESLWEPLGSLLEASGSPWKLLGSLETRCAALKCSKRS